MAGKGRCLLQIPVACAVISVFGVVAFVLGVFAEYSKPSAIPADHASDLTDCFYPAFVGFTTPVIGTLAALLLAVSSFAGFLSLLAPYSGKAVEVWVLCRSTGLVVFVLISLTVSLTAEGLLLWAVVSQKLANSSIHVGGDYVCPSAKPGLFGGAAFLALDATLLWLVCLMLAVNAREDYLGQDGDGMGAYGELPVHYNATLAPSTVDTASPPKASNVDPGLELSASVVNLHSVD